MQGHQIHAPLIEVPAGVFKSTFCQQSAKQLHSLLSTAGRALCGSLTALQLAYYDRSCSMMWQRARLCFPHAPCSSSWLSDG